MPAEKKKKRRRNRFIGLVVVLGLKQIPRVARISVRGRDYRQRRQYRASRRMRRVRWGVGSEHLREATRRACRRPVHNP